MTSLLDSFQPFAISLLIGLAAGIERERSQPSRDKVLGMRTFALIAVLGTAVGKISVSALTLAVALFVSAMVVAGYWRSTGPQPTLEAGRGERTVDPDKGLTTEFAACLVFVLGFMTIREPLLAVILGILLVAALYFRGRLHWFAKDVIKSSEIASALLLAGFVFVVIPFLPREAVDPWQLINPRRFAQVVAMIALVQFGGYVAQRVAGARVGLLVTGFLGGLASSTAVFLNLSRTAKEHPDQQRALVGAAMLATASPLVLFAGIVAVTSPLLVPLAGTPVLVAAVCAGVLGLAVDRKRTQRLVRCGDQANPLDVKGVLKLGVLIFGLLLVSALAQRYFGGSGIGIVSLLGGFFELHGVTFAAATMHAGERISDSDAARALLLAVCASILSKVAISWVLAPVSFAATVTMLETVVVGCGAAVYLLCS